MIPIRADRSWLLATVGTLALGIGSAAALWSATGTVAAAYGWSKSSRLVWIMETTGGDLRTAPSSAAIEEWKSNLKSFKQLAAFRSVERSIRVGDEIRVSRVVQADPELFDLMDIRPTNGRRLASEDGDAAVLVGGRLGSAAFGSPEAALGRSIAVNGQAKTIVGIVSRDLESLIDPNERIDVVEVFRSSAAETAQAVATLRDGTSIGQAQAELTSWGMSRGAEAQTRWEVLTHAQVAESAAIKIFEACLVGGALLLLVALCNLGHLLLVRNERMSKQIALRWALGATPWRIAWWRSREAVGLAAVGAIAGVLLCNWIILLITRQLPAGFEVLDSTSTNLAVTAVIALGALLVLLLFSLPPTLKRQSTLVEALRTDHRFVRRSNFRAFGNGVYLVTLLAASCVFIVVAYLMTATVLTFANVNIGFTPDRLQVLKLTLPDWKYAGAAERATVMTLVLDGLARHSRIQAAAVASSAPPATGVFVGQLAFGEQESAFGTIGVSSVSPGYFRAMGQRLIAGREFAADSAGEVVIVSQLTSSRFDPKPEAAIGKTIRFGKDLRRIVGVVSDVRVPGVVDALKGQQVYWPITRYRASSFVLMRADDNALPEARGIIDKLDHDIAIEATPMDVVLGNPRRQVKFVLNIFVALAAVSAFLALIGVYAVFSGFVARQKASIAVRMALGANASVVRRWVLTRALTNAILGITLGIALSYPFGRLFSGYLFGVSSGDHTARIVAALATLTIAGLAAWLPSQQASSVMPNEVLRET